MAYKRFARRRVRRRFHRGARKHKSLAAKVQGLAKVVRRNKIVHRVIQAQYVTYASRLGNQDISSSLACQNLTPTPSLGVAFDSRQTPCIRLQSLKLGISPLTSATGDIIRCQIFMTPEPLNSGQSANTGFNAFSGTANAPIGPLQPSNLCSFKYKLLYDSGPRAMGVTGGLRPYDAWTVTIPMKGKQLDYSSAGSGSFPYQDNIYMVVWGEQAPGAGPTYITTTICSVAYQWLFST